MVPTGGPTGLNIRLDRDEVEWRDTNVRGVHWHLLAQEGDDPGGAGGAHPGGAVLIRMGPGRGYPPHRHLGSEEVLVLAGGYRDDRGTHRAGDYVRYEPGSVHAPVALGDEARAVGPDNPACVLFATVRVGIEPLSVAGPVVGWGGPGAESQSSPGATP